MAITCTTVLAGILLGTTMGVEPPTIETLEKSAVNARLAIKSASVELRVRGHIAKQGKVIDYTHEYSISVEGARLRADVVRTGSGPNLGVRTVDCKNCERLGWGLHYDETPRHIAEFKPLNTPGRPDLHDAIDPRKIGYAAVPFQLLRGSRLDELLMRPDRKEPVLSSEELEGRKCWVIRFAFNPPEYKTRATIWIRPDAGNNVTRIELTEDKPDPSVWIAASDLVRMEGTNLWFPRKVVYETRKGDNVRRRETIDVTEAILNKPIPPETFSLSGIGIREGTYIQLPDDKKSGYWRNGRIDTENRPVFKDTSPPAPTPISTPSSAVNYWLLGGSAAFALGAVAVILFRRRIGPAV